LRVITRGVAVFGTARPQGKTFIRFQSFPVVAENRPACPVTALPNHAGRKRHSDASARVSLAGCVPAEPASVFPRSARMPQRPPFVTCLINAVNCGMNMVRIFPIERSHAPRSSCSRSLHASTANSRSEWMQMTCMNRFWNFRKTPPVVGCLSVTRRQGPTPAASAAFAARKAPP
jgi:hypothetical protein